MSVPDAWVRCLSLLENAVAIQSYNNWLKPLVCTQCDGQKTVLEAPDEFFAEFVRSNYLDKVTDALNHLFLTSSKVSIITGSTSITPTATTAPAPKTVAVIHKSVPKPAAGIHLNGRYTFDNLIVGPSNEWAVAAAKAVASTPGVSTANPLLLYGKSGMGKTHMIQAIAQKCLTMRCVTHVCYVTSERLMQDFVKSLKAHKMEQFVAHYRKTDLLLVDDIQFLAGKSHLQEEFFHTFNALHQDGKQIVLTADCSPDKLPDVEERLISRFQGGLVADIQPPDFETRVTILLRKSCQHGLALSEEVANYIAEHITGNVRRLEGIINSLMLLSNHLGRQVCQKLAEQVLKSHPQLTAPKGQITVEGIQQAVAKETGVTRQMLVSRSRHKEVALARQIAMYLCKRLTPYPLKRIASYFNRRDHTTVIHACSKIEKRLSLEPSLARQITAISTAIGGPPLH